MIAGCADPATGVATLSCIFPVLATIIYWALVFAGIVAVVLIIISGIRFITSGGDAKRLDQARKTMTYAIAGLLVVFLSFFIVNFIAETTGVA